MALRSIDPSESGTHLWATIPFDWRRPTVRHSYHLYWRDEDGFGQIVPRPPLADIPTFYAVDDYYTHRNGPSTPPLNLSFLQKVIRHLAWRADAGSEPDVAYFQSLIGKTGRDILEIGCGNGDRLAALASLGNCCCGVEPDTAAIAIARQSGLEILAGTAEDLPERIQNRRFDCVIMSHVLEHCYDPVRAVQNARALLKEAGILVIEVPNNDCLGRLFFGKVWLWLDVPRHLNFFSQKSLRTLLSDLGFEELRFEFRGYARQFSAEWQVDQNRIAQMFDTPGRSSPLALATYLAQTAFAAPKHKYDSILAVAIAPP